MKTLQNYIDRYSTIAKNLGYSGQSVEVLVQLLSQASYISEIENASYMSEASLEKCSLINSKIQHCVDRMYSVFRGSCPRVIMKIKPTKYLTFNPYDKIIDSQNFTVHYLGYYQVSDSTGKIIGGVTEDDPEVEEKETVSNKENIMDSTFSTNDEDLIETPDELPNETLDELLKYKGVSGKWHYSSATFYPVVSDENKSGVQIIIGFIAPKRNRENLKIEEHISTKNSYYVECLENNLSDDMYIELGTDDMLARIPRTRVFAEHILEHKIFDLTLPGFGSRLYLANYYKDTIGRDSNEVEGMTKNTKILAQYYEYSKLSDYNDSELSKVQLKGAELLPFLGWNDGVNNRVNEFLKRENLVETNKGLCYREEISRDTAGTIHYKANRDRFVNSIIRSNSDIGTVLEESFPNIIISGGTSYLFNASNSDKKSSSINLYYIPKNESNLLSPDDIDKFVKEKRAYYIITTKISVKPGNKYIASFNLDLDLYNNSGENDFEKEIGQDILVNNYGKKFGVVFNESTRKEIESLISKIPNVKLINSMNITYTDASGRVINPDPNDSKQYYFDIKYSITTKVTQKL